MMSMMHSTPVLIMMMTFLVLVVGGVIVAVRVLGGRAYDDDHRPEHSHPRH